MVSVMLGPFLLALGGSAGAAPGRRQFVAREAEGLQQAAVTTNKAFERLIDVRRAALPLPPAAEGRYVSKRNTMTGPDGDNTQLINVRLPAAVCAVVGEVLPGSHPTLDALFRRAGAPGEPPQMSHASKWKTWLLSAGDDPDVDSLKVLALVLEEFMDISPAADTPEFATWQSSRQRVVTVLEEYGLRYYRGGRVLPTGEAVSDVPLSPTSPGGSAERKPSSVHELLSLLIRGLPRAMHPLTHRRRGATSLTFESEYDVQDLLHALLRPWVADIRPEEFTPSYAGSSTRMDFLLPTHRIVLELKLVRDRAHGRKVGDELIIDIEHYRRHPDCEALWCVVYDPDHLIPNPAGLTRDLEGERKTPDGRVDVRVFILAT